MTIAHKKGALRLVPLVAAALLSLSGCSDEAQNEYTSDIPCSFTFDITRHAASPLAAAVQPFNYGQYVIVSTEVRTVGATPTSSGYSVRYVVTQDADGHTDRTTITAADELRSAYNLGAMNGLIIGQSASDQANPIFAFDRQCPNCRRQYNLYRYALTFANSGHWVHCANCSRDYNLDNGGYPVSGGGRKLDRYVAALLTNTITTGQYLSVHNR